MARDDIPVTRTAKGRAYDAYLRELRTMSTSSDPKVRDEWRAANEDLVRLKTSPSEVSSNPILTNLVTMYQNDLSIADRCMPVIFTGGKTDARYYNHDARSMFSLPDASVAEGGLANEVSEHWEKLTVALTGKALAEAVGEGTLQNADEPLQPLVDATKNVLANLDNIRENQVGTIVMTSTNYGANTTAVGAADKWDSATGGDPPGLVYAGRDACLPGGPNTRMIGVMPPAVWTVLKTHNRFLDIYKATGGGEMLRAAAEWLELDELLVARKWYESTNEGITTPTYARMWANGFAILCVAPDPMIQTASFGFTFQDKPTLTTQKFDEERGARGAYNCRAGHHDVSQVVGALTSYLIQNPLT
jgi:hypothetical protein